MISQGRGRERICSREFLRRRLLGKKNCELGGDDIERICETFLAFEENEQSRIFDNADFGYWKLTIERPLRIEGADPNRAHKAAEIKQLKEHGKRGEAAPRIIRKIHKRGTEPDILRGRFVAMIDGNPAVVEYEPDPDLRDTEQIPLREEGGIEAFLHREVLPYAKDAWYKPESVKIGYEISFNCQFYKPTPLRTLDEIRADILALQAEADSLLPDFILREPKAEYAVKPRIYVDTSVFGGCEEEKFRESSRRLFDAFHRGDATLIFSEMTRQELEGAPASVRAVIKGLPKAHFETLPASEAARKLADAYIESKAVGPAHYNDAMHIAIASIGRVDVLASWNFKHMVNWGRIQAYNNVNRKFGYPEIDIRSPESMYHDD